MLLRFSIFFFFLLVVLEYCLEYSEQRTRSRDRVFLLNKQKKKPNQNGEQGLCVCGQLERFYWRKTICFTSWVSWFGHKQFNTHWIWKARGNRSQRPESWPASTCCWLKTSTKRFIVGKHPGKQMQCAHFYIQLLFKTLISLSVSITISVELRN